MIAAAVAFVLFMFLKKSYDPERNSLNDVTVVK
jgi:hypothetical protein